jgi:hypothetical protein
MGWADASGDVWISGGLGIDSAGTFGFLDDLWKYDPTTGQRSGRLRLEGHACG